MPLIRLQRSEGQGECEGGALAGAIAVGGKGAAQFAGGQGAAVEAEAVAVAPGGEAMGEDAVRFSAGMPMPLSMTWISTWPSAARRTRTVMSLCGDWESLRAYLALRMTLMRIWSTLCLSTRNGGSGSMSRWYRWCAAARRQR